MSHGPQMGWRHPRMSAWLAARVLVDPVALWPCGGPKLKRQACEEPEAETEGLKDTLTSEMTRHARPDLELKGATPQPKSPPRLCLDSSVTRFPGWELELRASSPPVNIIIKRRVGRRGDKWEAGVWFGLGWLSDTRMKAESEKQQEAKV